MERCRFEDLNPADYALPAGLEEQLHSPALIVFMERVRQNVGRVLEYTGGPDRWRPHLKTTKMPEVWRELLAAGVRHFKCATVREVQHLLQLLRDEALSGADVLLAYPLIGPGLERLGELATAYPETNISVLSEDATAVDEIPASISVFVDVNPGMHRTGIPLSDSPAIHATVHAAGERFRGLHFYEGHLHDADLEQRRQAAFAEYDGLLQLVRALAGEGVRVGELITSGTPAFLHALAYEPFGAGDTPTHRVSPGTVVFHDLRSEQENPDLDLTPAACVFTRVVSLPAPGTVTCDAGSKSIATEAHAPCAFVLDHAGWEPGTPSEEHLPLAIHSGGLPIRGKTLLLVPQHVCPTVNLAEDAILVEDGTWRRATVAARAHDLLRGG